MYISGGLHVGGELAIEDQDGVPTATWGTLCSIDRHYGHVVEPWTGTFWSLTFFSDARSKCAQPYARLMIDSVADGTLVQLDQPEQEAKVYRTQLEELEVCHSDKKYPPWINHPKDGRGLPLPFQRDDWKHDEKLRVVPPTDEELESTLEQIGITGNQDLSEEQKHHFKCAVSYCWGCFDPCLRPVDSDPVGIQFLDPKQQPIKLQPYRCNAPMEPNLER